MGLQLTDFVECLLASNARIDFSWAFFYVFPTVFVSEKLTALEAIEAERVEKLGFFGQKFLCFDSSPNTLTTVHLLAS